MLVILIVFVCLAALLPMTYTQPWNIKVALTLFFFAYPALHWVGPIGMLTMWGIAAGFIFIPKPNAVDDRSI